MFTLKYRYHLGIIGLAAVLSVASYVAVLRMLDSIISDYDVYSFSRQVSRDPQSIERRFIQLKEELTEKKGLLQAVRSKNSFTQDVFQALAHDHHCRLVQLSNRTDVKERSVIYEGTFSGTARRVLNLLHDLERNYLVDVTRVLLLPDDERGAMVRMTISLALDANELK